MRDELTFVVQPLWVKLSTRQLHSSVQSWLSSAPLHCWGHWGPERCICLLKAAELGSGKTDFWTHVGLIPKPMPYRQCQPHYNTWQALPISRELISSIHQNLSCVRLRSLGNFILSRWRTYHWVSSYSRKNLKEGNLGGMLIVCPFSNAGSIQWGGGFRGIWQESWNFLFLFLLIKVIALYHKSTCPTSTSISKKHFLKKECS